MPRKKEVEITSFSDLSSPDLLLQLHAAKRKKDRNTSEMINAELSRRYLIEVNESIHSKSIGYSVPTIVAVAPPKQHAPRKKQDRSGCTHCLCLIQKAFFGSLETKMCCKCGHERIAA